MQSGPHQSTVVDEIYCKVVDLVGNVRLDNPDKRAILVVGLSCLPQVSACIMSPRSRPVRRFALRASQYMRPIIINIEGTAMMG
jgi:hypothetical protein